MYEPVTLGFLRWHYGGAYIITMRPGRRIEAQRRDDGSLIRADTADAMLAELRADYRARPVPRDLPSMRGTS
jgi:hypothetical protein